MRAAETAESLLAYEEAAGFYQMALDALRHDESADEKLRCRLLVAAARATSKSGHVTETIELARRGAECARRIGDTAGLVDACRAIDYIVANLGRCHRGARRRRTALLGTCRSAGHRGPAQRRARALPR